MEVDLHGGRFEPLRTYNPWDKFKVRNDRYHLAEDTARLFPTTDPCPTSSEVIDRFLKQNSHRLDRLIPRRWQILKDFLDEVVRGSPSGTSPYTDNIRSYRTNIDIVLLDDRRKHGGCGKSVIGSCSECHIWSRELKIPDLCERLLEEVSTHTTCLLCT